MTDAQFDHDIQSAIPPVTIAEYRVEQLISTVLAQTRCLPASNERRWPQFVRPSWPTVLQFALPALVAVILGVSLGGVLANDGPLEQFSSLIFSTSLMSVES